jgi:hypothetical protein
MKPAEEQNAEQRVYLNAGNGIELINCLPRTLTGDAVGIKFVDVFLCNPFLFPLSASAQALKDATRL